MLLAVLRRKEGRGAAYSAKRLRQICDQVFRYAIAVGSAEHNPAPNLKGALQPPVKTHLAAVTDPKKVGGLLRALDSYDGTLITKCALRLAPLVFVRPDFIEHQLAHAVRDANGRAYNRTAHLAERRKMMQLWADYLDCLKVGAEVVPMRRAGQ